MSDKYIVTVEEEPGCLSAFLGIIVIIAIIIAACTGGSSDNNNSSGYTYDDEESYAGYSEDYEDDYYGSDSSNTYTGSVDTGSSSSNSYVESKTYSLEELCFYSGNHMYSGSFDSKEDIFGKIHYDVIGVFYSFDQSYTYEEYRKDNIIKYYLAGDYSSLTFTTFTTSGCTESYATIYVSVSYDGTDDDILVYSDDFYGGVPAKTVTLDLTGVTYLYIIISPFDCTKEWGHGDCDLWAGDFELK